MPKSVGYEKYRNLGEIECQLVWQISPTMNFYTVQIFKYSFISIFESKSKMHGKLMYALKTVSWYIHVVCTMCVIKAIFFAIVSLVNTYTMGIR